MIKSFYLIASLIIFFFANSTAYAYVDPGVTGLIFQFGYAIIIAVIAWFAGLRSVFSKIYRKLFQKEHKQESSSDISNTREEDV